MRNIIIFLMTLFCYQLYSQNLEFRFTDKIDLNSDGILDNVLLEEIESDTSGYRLQINEAEIYGSLGDPIDGFQVVDIAIWDKYKEIAVHTSGMSDDDMYRLYGYDGSSIHFMNELSGLPKFTGNGIVYVNDWMGFWSKRNKYKLDNTIRKLQLVEQEAYYVGLKTEVKKGFKIYKQKDLLEEVALLKDNSTIEFLICDLKGRDYLDYRYLIKSSSGLIGWADFSSFYENMDLLMAD